MTTMFNEKITKKLKALSAKLDEKNLKLLGIESITAVNEAAKSPKLIFKYKNGETMSYSGDEILIAIQDRIDALKRAKEEKEKEFYEKYNDLESSVKENITTFSLEQISGIQSKLKELESKLRNEQKNKVKTITISEDVHNKVKKYCVDKDVKLSDWVEETLLNGINQ